MDHSKPTILIVDDERFFINVLVDLLKPKYRTVVALTGQQAIDRTLSDTPPDLILLDIIMPGMDGYEVCHRLKQNPVSQDIPIIFLTSRNDVGAETKGFNLGAIDYITKPISPPTVLARVNTHLTLERTLEELNIYNRQLEQTVAARTHDLTQEIIDRKKAEEQLYRLENFDQVTGLPTERLFRQQVAHSLKQARRNNKTVSLVAIDVDHFNQLEKSLGPKRGKQLFTHLTSRLANSVREADTLGRVNSGRFALALMEATEKTITEVVHQKIQQALNQPFRIDDDEYRCKAWIGVAIFPHDANNIEDLIKNAEWAAYLAKINQSGIQFYAKNARDPQPDATIVDELRRAIEHDDLLLHFQEVVASDGHRVCAAETFPQWRNSKRELLLAESLMPIADENGLYSELINWLLQRALSAFTKWQSSGPSDLTLNLRIESRSFYYSQCVAAIENALRGSALPPEQLNLAISESILHEAPSESINKFHQLKDLGIQLSIDDFGIGYSSVTSIRKYPADHLKLHKSVIRCNPDGTMDKILIQAMIDLAHTLGFEVVARGVENQHQKTILEELGCEYLQGRTIGEPLPEDEFIAKISRQKAI